MDGRLKTRWTGAAVHRISPVHPRFILLSIDFSRTLLGHVRDSVAISDVLHEQLHPFSIRNMFASVGATGSSEDVEARLLEWLATRRSVTE